MEDLQSQTKPQWTFYTIRHAKKERPPTKYIMDMFLATHTVNIFYGAPGSLKSMILLFIALCVATGKRVLPGLPGHLEGIETTPVPVIWVDMDNGTRRTHERIDAVSKALGITEDCGNFYYVSMPQPSLVANDIESMSILMDAIKGLGAGMVVIDNLGLVTGDVEENSASMAQIMGNFRWMADTTGAAICLLHHQRKGGAQGSRAGDALRGHSSIEASLDLAIRVTRADDQNTNRIELGSTKTRGVDVPPISCEFFYEHVPGTRDLASAYFAVVQPKRGENPARDGIIDILEANPNGMTKTRLVAKVCEYVGKETSREKVRGWLDDMVGITGEVIIEDGNYNAKIYKLSSKISLRK